MQVILACVLVSFIYPYFWVTVCFYITNRLGVLKFLQARETIHPYMIIDLNSVDLT